MSLVYSREGGSSRPRWKGHTMRRTPAQLVVATAATVVLAACGSPGGYGSSAQAGASTTSGGDSGGPETIGTGTGTAGTHLTADQGRAVYLFDADTSGTSTCTGPCAQAWPPVLTRGAAKASGAATAGDLGTVQRADGTTQVTYHGHPLYYYADDKDAADTYGEGSKAFGATWWLVSPDGTALTSHASSSAGNSPSTSPSNGSGGYGYGGGGYGG